jgi:hypothetical protein
MRSLPPGGMAQLGQKGVSNRLCITLFLGIAIDLGVELLVDKQSANFACGAGAVHLSSQAKSTT